MTPDPLLIPWRGRQLRVRHDDPRIGPYSPTGQRIRAAVELATDVEGLRLVLATTVGERYRVRVAEDGGVVGLWRRSSIGVSSRQAPQTTLSIVAAKKRPG